MFRVRAYQCSMTALLFLDMNYYLTYGSFMMMSIFYIEVRTLAEPEARLVVDLGSKVPPDP